MVDVSLSEERQLVEAARSGDAAAVESLVERHQSRVYRFALKMCRRDEDAEDVLQETLLAAARTIKGYRGDASLSTWLYTIARSFCIKKRRRRKHAPAPAQVLSLGSEEARAVLQLPDPGRAPDESLHERELATELGRAVEALAPGYREVLVLRDVEGLPASEVAKVMGLTVQAVKSRLHRARSQVREALAPFLGGAEPGRRPKGCPDIVTLFSRHLEDDIDPAVCGRMERHLASCPRCEAACDSLREVLRLCHATPAPRVPASVQDAVRREVEAVLGSGAPDGGRDRK